MTNDLIKRPAAPGAMVSIEQERAVMEVQAAVMVAKRFPRFMPDVKERILAECGNKDLAEKAIYSYPRGDQTVTGPSVRLAEVMARNFQNMNFGVREVSQRAGESDAEAFAWDIENNVKESRQFIVKHERKARGSIRKLTDPRDIYEMVANQGARRMRACILALIPKDIQDAAVQMCTNTLEGSDPDPLNVRVNKMVAAFKAFNVTGEMISKRLGHVLKKTTAHEVVQLKAVYRALRDGFASVDDYFGDDAPEPGTGSTTSRIKGRGDDATVGKISCPFPGCKAKLKSDQGLKTHLTRQHPDFDPDTLKNGEKPEKDLSGSGNGQNDNNAGQNSGIEDKSQDLTTDLQNRAAGDGADPGGDETDPMEKELEEKRREVVALDRARTMPQKGGKLPLIAMARNAKGINKQALVLTLDECDELIAEYKSLKNSTPHFKNQAGTVSAVPVNEDSRR